MFDPYQNRVFRTLIIVFFFNQRHRMVNGLIKEKLQEQFPHALSLETKSPSQWKPNYHMEASPNCKGGFGK